MPIEISNIIPSKTAEATPTIQFTAVSKTVIDAFTATNIDSDAGAFICWLVPSGDTASDDNLLIINKYIWGEDSYYCPELVGQVMEPGDFIATNTVGASIVIRATGRIIT